MMNLKPTTIKTRKRQAGLTLLELTVVMLILIGLAGLALPYASGFLQRAHDSTGASNLQAINQAIDRYEVEYLGQPDGWHSLINGGNTVVSYLMKPSLLTALRTTTIMAGSLKNAGIEKVYVMQTSATNPTFDAVSGAPISITGGASGTYLASVAALDLDGDGTNSVAEHLAAAFKGNADQKIAYDDTCYAYIVFGLGPENDMVGRTMNDAPMHIAGKDTMMPDKKYNRFVVVYRVDKDNSTSGCSSYTEKAKRVGAAMLMMKDNLWGSAVVTEHAWTNMTAGTP